MKEEKNEILIPKGDKLKKAIRDLLKQKNAILLAHYYE